MDEDIAEFLSILKLLTRLKSIPVNLVRISENLPWIYIKIYIIGLKWADSYDDILFVIDIVPTIST